MFENDCVMVKILFICLDDEYFSPMAKMVMRDLVSKAGLEGKIFADSAGVNSTAAGKPLKEEAIAVLKKNGITPAEHTGQCFFDVDFEDYDLLVVLDLVSSFVINRHFGDTRDIKLRLLLQFAGERRDVSDPFDTHEDDSTFNDVMLGCKSLLDLLLRSAEKHKDVQEDEEEKKDKGRNAPRLKKVQTLLLLDELMDTDEKHPKNSAELAKAVEKRWEKLTGEKETLSEPGIQRQIKDINQSGIMEIETCTNKKRGYYRNDHPLEPSEVAVIAQAVFRTQNLNKKASKRVLQSLQRLTNIAGRQHLDGIMEQLERTTLRRKPQYETILYAINALLEGIIKHRKVMFNCYVRTELDKTELVLVTEKNSKEPKKYVVSPYYLVWEDEECYLVCHDPENDTAEGHRLTHYRLSLFANVEVLEEATISIGHMIEFYRYAIPYTFKGTGEWLPGTMTDGRVPGTRQYWLTTEENRKRLEEGKPPIMSKEEALKLFALDRYVRENVYMYHNDKPPVYIKLFFREDALEDILRRFNLDKKDIAFNRVTSYFSDGEQVCTASVTAQPNEGLYKWLVKQSNEVIVAKPDFVREEVKRRLQVALRGIESYERKDDAEIDRNVMAADLNHEMMMRARLVNMRTIEFE